MSAGLGSLRVLSINVNGLQSNATKRKTFFQYLAQVQADVVVVQETHCSSEDQAQHWVQRGEGPGLLGRARPSGSTIPATVGGSASCSGQVWYQMGRPR